MSSKSKLTIHSEAYNDKGVMDSMMELFEGIMTPGASGQRRVHQKLEEHVLWARFEECDLNDTYFNTELVNVLQTQQEEYAPLVLLLGTTAGLQVWCIDPKGEAHLLMNYYEALVRHAKILPAPELKDVAGDAYASRRPILVLNSVPHGAVNPQAHSVAFISLRNKEDLRPTNYDREVKAILGNKRFVVVCMSGKLVVYNNHDLRERITIINSVPFNDCDSCPVALGNRWLAFGDRKHEPLNQSLGGITTENMSSYTSTFINVVDVVMQGLSFIGESAVNTWASGSGPQDRRQSGGNVCGSSTSGRQHGGRTPSSGEATPSSDSPGEEGGPGFVSVVDLYKLTSLAPAEPVNVHHTDSDGLVAHFPAHATAAVACLRFDGSAQLLLSACRQGRDFHVYRLLPHPRNSQQTAVHHLYALHRGDTTAQVADVAFAADSRWVAVSTRHGTTHVFPLTPYGGPISARTHAQSRVVNRTSRFLQSAGVDERTTVTAQGGRESPAARGQAAAAAAAAIPNESPIPQKVPIHNSNNPRLPPFPVATQMTPYLQIKQTYAAISKWRSALSQWQADKKSASGNMMNNTVNREQSNSATSGQDAPLPLVACFAHARARLAGQTPNTSYVREREREAKPPLDALFLVSCDGRIVEHILDLRPRRDRPLSGSSSNPAGSYLSSVGGMQQWAGYPKDGPIELVHWPRAQWVLSRQRAIAAAAASSQSARSVQVPTPALTNSHPLVASAETVQQSQHRRSAGSWTALSSTPSSHFGSDFPADGFGRTASSDSLAHRPPSIDSLPSSEASESESWLAQVEIVTHIGPHRRLWMGPQFTFKTYQSSPLISTTSASSVVLTSADTNSIPAPGEELEATSSGDSTGLSPASVGVQAGVSQHVRSHPLPAPRSAPRGRNTSGSPRASCVYIEAGSFNDSYGSVFEGLEGNVDEEAIRESLAEAMLEPRSCERRSTPAREFIHEADFQNESWSSGSDCLPESGRLGQRMQFP